MYYLQFESMFGQHSTIIIIITNIHLMSRKQVNWTIRYDFACNFQFICPPMNKDNDDVDKFVQWMWHWLNVRPMFNDHWSTIPQYLYLCAIMCECIYVCMCVCECQCTWLIVERCQFIKWTIINSFLLHTTDSFKSIWRLMFKSKSNHHSNTIGHVDPIRVYVMDAHFVLLHWSIYQSLLCYRVNATYSYNILLL